ncbi:diacylglycerol kinase [Haloactinospora alba]|uniref:Diacylglycerol kinase n=1 Tax=Haloactinospora alba TaxID=405555 RepID=A0A543NIU1_9ACTN|nr:YegS/Rv2252/BmrU family lipid kinase [Haloactinospora alba]TQN31771.1 diacylglycerol kinase [Haloactinospora alba]
MPPSVALLVNPASPRAARTGARLVQRLRSRGAGVTVVAGRSAEESAERARKAVLAGPDALVAVGGDGQAHMALQAVADTDVPLGVVPTGTGNDIARELGIPRSLTAAVDMILRDETVASDTVHAAGRHFLSVLACGFDSQVNERVNGFPYSFGRVNYLAGLVAELGAFQPVPFTVSVDGRELDFNGMLVAVGNTASYGGGMRVCPDAVHDDGLLDVVLVHEVPRAAFLRFFPSVLNGTHTRLDEVTTLRGREITITSREEGTRRPPTGYADGERLGELPITCRVVPRAVRVLVPDPH